MKIAIITAMNPEMELLRNITNAYLSLSIAGCDIYHGKFDHLHIALLKTGIGKVSAAIGTTLLIKYFSPKYIINTGSSGRLFPTLKIADIVISTHVCYHDVNVTAFDYQLGQMAQCPATFIAEKELILTAKESIKILNLHAMYGLICTGDSFINNIKDVNYIRKHFPDALAVDMEGAAIAHVCYKFNIPFIVVRSISDIADEKSNFYFNNFLPIAAQQSNRIVETMLILLSKKTKNKKLYQNQ
ncbi:5'-methylthioadenosine/S-adenosylhomocysteine nucleosidase [Arsenophonus symbiont of Ornithomya chloropus]|uniref:5'-methylthioadenosine/S-adenosylhomocysteine nucleosidase n=1 Tax=Arsenophonus symbiont of Ornithomya chloropus TaxID=634121 RepID=UPI0032B15591